VQKNKLPDSQHFTLEQLASGVYACIHKSGGAAYSNAGIVDLGDKTIVVDAFDTMAAGHDLRQAAEFLLERPIDWLILTHTHSDHWVGASVFDETTVLLASKITRKISTKWGAMLLRNFKNTGAWEKESKKIEEQIKTEKDEQVRASLENSLIRTRYVMAEMAIFQPRYADQTFDGTVTFQGSQRTVEFRSMGRGHSEDDAVLFLPQDRIAFIGDIGFFDTQPFLGFCDIAPYRKQMQFFQDSEYDVLVPGHGPVGNRDDILLQLKYLDVMEERVGKVVERGGSFEEAMEITLPEPFNKWLVGGMGRFEANVRYLFKHFGGKIPKGA